MYVDGIILLALYVLASAALILGVYNNLELKELVKKLSRPVKKQLPPPKEIKRPKGFWD